MPSVKHAGVVRVVILLNYHSSVALVLSDYDTWFISGRSLIGWKDSLTRSVDFRSLAIVLSSLISFFWLSRSFCQASSILVRVPAILALKKQQCFNHRSDREGIRTQVNCKLLAKDWHLSNFHFLIHRLNYFYNWIKHLILLGNEYKPALYIYLVLEAAMGSIPIPQVRGNGVYGHPKSKLFILQLPDYLL